MPGQVARIAFRFFAQRKNHPRQLVLPQGKQEITLILPQIAPALQQVPPRFGGSRSGGVRIGFRILHSALHTRCGPLHPREMAGGDEGRAELIGPVNEPAKFQVLIAHHAGIGRASGLVFIGKVLDDVLLKIR